MILLIDNYDSFSYNLVQLVGSICKEKEEVGKFEEIHVIRNDECNIDEIEKMAPDYIILSPGPGRPRDAGVCEDLVLHMKGKAKILGVCLGHQGICEAFGATITYAKELMHGKQSEITVSMDPIFKGITDGCLVARYHSLAVDKESIPKELDIIAETKDGEVMAVKHKKYDIYGLQFHPESVLTPEGKRILENFLG
ncbi:anthranilate synthase component II [Clostridium sp. Marseille-P299]|uniref:anthranilate synthase component II n=1 Tax=Clostridium sp. Marseille-P299 TaxID=1805477 RepID=UPI00082C0103|nr:aminodeoxychorismate/anthranilate synthase component II [Clostridium sp. Marseille-P299]